MDGSLLRETLQVVLPTEEIADRAREFGVVERYRKLDVAALVSSLVLSSGSDDSGRLADAYRRYQGEAEHPVVRGSFYNWIDEETAALMEELLDRALGHARSQPVHLPGTLGTVKDWLIIDSETVTLRPALSGTYPGTSTPAGVKVHKVLSVGRGCMVDYHLSPSREHDSPHLELDARWRGHGVLVDLGYVSREFIRRCGEHGISYVIRLKDNWKPRVSRIVRPAVSAEFVLGTDLDGLIDQDVLVLDGRDIDVDVIIGDGGQAVCARLVGVSGPKGYRFYLTSLERRTHGAGQVAELYRVRWEIESDNKLDKSAARLDQVRATTSSSVRVLVYAALLHSLIADLLVHKDLLDREERKATTRAPLHRLLVAHAIRDQHLLLLQALLMPTPPPTRWDRLANAIAEQGRDPNWRRRPSVLDRMRGLVAPRGRPRRKTLSECPPSAAPYRRSPSEIPALS